MVTKFYCTCGNTNPQNAYHYHGLLGYELLICRICGKSYDFGREHEPNEFTKQFINT